MGGGPKLIQPTGTIGLMSFVLLSLSFPHIEITVQYYCHTSDKNPQHIKSKGMKKYDHYISISQHHFSHREILFTVTMTTVTALRPID